MLVFYTIISFIYSPSVLATLTLFSIILLFATNNDPYNHRWAWGWTDPEWHQRQVLVPRTDAGGPVATSGAGFPSCRDHEEQQRQPLCGRHTCQHTESGYPSTWNFNSCCAEFIKKRRYKHKLSLLPGGHCWDCYPGTHSSLSSHCKFENWVPIGTWFSDELQWLNCKIKYQYTKSCIFLYSWLLHSSFTTFLRTSVVAAQPAPVLPPQCLPTSAPHHSCGGNPSWCGDRAPRICLKM